MTRSSVRRSIACLLLVVGAACSSDGGSDGPAAGDGSAERGPEQPLALIGVLRQDPPAEVPAADLYLVELGEPVADGILVDDDSGYQAIRIGAADANPTADPPDHVEGFVRLPDDRLLIGIARPSTSDDEYVDEVAAVVVDPASGAVEDVFREVEKTSWDAASTTWDPEQGVLRTASERCFTWTAEAPGSGFDEGACPEVPRLDEAIDPLARWDVACCDPFQLTDRESGDVVFEQPGMPQPAASNPEDLPSFIDQVGDVLLFDLPVDPGTNDVSPRRLLLLDGDGAVAEIAGPSDAAPAEVIERAATIEGGAVLFSESDPRRAGSDDRLLRYDIATGTTEVLVEGGRLRWTVVPGDEPWLSVWQEPSGEAEPMATSVWTGDASGGALERVARWTATSHQGSSAALDPASSTIFFNTQAMERPGDPTGRGVRMWRLGPTGSPIEQATAEIVLDASDAGQVVRTTPDGCTQPTQDGSCDTSLELIVDGERRPIDLPAVPYIDTPHLLADGTTIVVHARLELGGAPYQDAIWAIDLDAPDDPRVLYGPSDDLPAGAVLLEVDGTTYRSMLENLDLCPYGCGNPRLPQVNDAASWALASRPRGAAA